jgi:CMP-N-acetylneuraminic acid synthetase
LGITLARVGSKSVPKKNIQIIAGKPLLCYTIEEALKSSYLNRYIVSTDDPEIQNVAIEAGAEAPFLRPAEFSNDNATSVSALQHAVSWAEQDKGKEYDFIVELMCTNPLKTVEDIDACIHKLVATGADSVIAVHKVEDHHPIRIKKIVDDKIADFCLPEIPEIRRQDLKPEAYIRSGSIYALTRDHLMKDCKRYGSKNSRPYILSSNRAVNIDSKIDLFKAEAILKDLD